MAKLTPEDIKALAGIRARSIKKYGGKGLGRKAELATLRRNKARGAHGAGAGQVGVANRRPDLPPPGIPGTGPKRPPGTTVSPNRGPGPRPIRPGATTGTAGRRPDLPAPGIPGTGPKRPPTPISPNRGPGTGYVPGSPSRLIDYTGLNRNKKPTLPKRPRLG